MACFHFQLRTDSHVLLTEAAELAGATEARVEAARRIGALLTTHADVLWVDQDWRMDVTNEVGLILFVISISASRSSATMVSDPRSPLRQPPRS